MKLAVSGKGGVGKTTFSALLIRTLNEHGKRVLAIDADPDANLAAAIGIANAENITPVAEMKELIERDKDFIYGDVDRFIVEYLNEREFKNLFRP